MSRKTIEAFEKHTGRKSPAGQGVTFRDARKPGLGPSFDPSEFPLRSAPTLPPPPASVEVACLLARAQELEDTARMMLARARELREVARRGRP
jgi:hypothetical protein